MGQRPPGVGGVLAWAEGTPSPEATPRLVHGQDVGERVATTPGGGDRRGAGPSGRVQGQECVSGVQARRRSRRPLCGHEDVTLRSCGLWEMREKLGAGQLRKCQPRVWWGKEPVKGP